VPAAQPEPEHVPAPSTSDHLPDPQLLHVAEVTVVEPKGPNLPAVQGVPVHAVCPRLVL